MTSAAPGRRPPLTITADSRLSDDVLLVEPVSVDPGSVNTTAVAVDRTGAVRVFAVLPGRGAVELAPSAGSASGYAVTPLPGGADATEIVAVKGGGGGLFVAYVAPMRLAVVREAPGGGWTEPTALDGFASRLAATRVPGAGDAVVTAVDPAGDLTVLWEWGGTWTRTTLNLAGGALGADVRLTHADEGHWYVFAAVAGELRVWTGRDRGDVTAPLWRTHHPAGPATRILAAGKTRDDAVVVFATADHRALQYVGSRGHSTAVTSPGTVVTGAAAVGYDWLLRLYAADPDGTLALHRQTAWDAAGEPVWAPPLAIDHDAVAASTAAGPTWTTGPVLVTRADGTLDLLTQPPGLDRWERLPVHGAGAEVPLRTTRYRTRITVTDADGVHCAGAAVTVTPSSLVALEVGASSVIAAPDRPASLTTDLTGAVEVTQPATGLDSVTFTATVAGAPAPLAIEPYAYLHAALAGRAPVFTGSATVPPMSAATLLHASVGGTPLVPGLTADSAGDVADAIAHVVGLATGDTAVAGFELDLGDLAAPRFAVLAPEQLPPPAAGALPHLVADAWHAIRSGAVRIVHFVVDVGNRVATVVVGAAGYELHRLEGLALDTVAAVVSLATGVFRAFEATADRVLAWLRDSLDWDAVWATMQRFHQLVSAGFGELDRWLGSAAVVTTGRFFDDLRADVRAAVARAVDGLGDRRIGPAPAVLAAAGIPLGPPVRLPGSEAQRAWLQSKVTTHLAATQPVAPDVPAVPDDVLARASSAVAAVQADVAGALDDLKAFFTDLYERPHDLAEALAADLVGLAGAVADAVLAAADAAVEVVLELLGHLVGAAGALLDRPLPDVPVLGWLWDHVLRPPGADDPMTLGGLACLLLAAPVTLAVDVSAGDPDGDADAGAVPDRVQFWASAVLAAVDMVNDAANAAADASSSPDPPLVLWNLVDVVANAVDQGLSWPDVDLLVPDGWEHLTRGGRFTTATWLASWVPIGVDLACTIRAARPPFLPGLAELNQGLDSLAGLALCGTGVTGAVLSLHDPAPGTTTWADVVGAALGPLPWGTQWLLSAPLVESSDGLSTAVQLVVDFLGDVDWWTDEETDEEAT